MKKKSIIWIIIVLAIVILGAIFISQFPVDFKVAEEKKEIIDEKLVAMEKECNENNATWIADHNECEYSTSTWCRKNKGEFNECGSACRHEELEEGSVCTMQCVPFCKFTEREKTFAKGPNNTSYIIGSRQILFVDGKFEQEQKIGEHIIKDIFAIVKADTEVDINKDGEQDYVVIITKKTGNSQEFFYVAMAIKSENGYLGSNLAPIDNSLDIQSIEMVNGEVIVNYMARKPWEDLSQEPSVFKSKHLIWESGELKNVVVENNLSQSTIDSLVLDKWGDCSNNDCEEVEAVVIDGIDGVWYVGAIFTGLKDDSIAAHMKISKANYIDSEWILDDETYNQFRCQEGRGHRGFSSELCI